MYLPFFDNEFTTKFINNFIDQESTTSSIEIKMNKISIYLIKNSDIEKQI